MRCVPRREWNRNKCWTKTRRRDGQKSAEELSNLLRHPTAKMLEGEMKPVDMPDEDLKALVAYIKSLK